MKINGLGFSQWIWLLQEQRRERGAWGSLCTHPLGQHKGFISRLECFSQKNPDPQHDAGLAKPGSHQSPAQGKGSVTQHVLFNI